MKFSELEVGRRFYIVDDSLKKLNRPLLTSDFTLRRQLPLVKTSRDAVVVGKRNGSDVTMRISLDVTVYPL